MLPIRVGLASHSSTVRVPELVKVANALNIQVSRDVAPIWNVQATVEAVPDAKSIPVGMWPIFIVDTLDVGGVHKTRHRQPYALVEAGDTWSLAASHECIEMLVDPSGDRLVTSSSLEVVDNAVQDGLEKFEYLVEVCDPSEDPNNAYLVDDVLVADFYTPHFFDPAISVGVRYSFTGKITKPREVLPNGYLSWLNPTEGKLQQLRCFGAPVIIDLGDASNGVGRQNGQLKNLRELVDSQTRPPVRLSRLHHSDPMVQRRNRRRANLALARTAVAETYTKHREALTASLAPAKEPASPKTVIGRGIDKLKKPGVISVRPGYVFEHGWITDRRAIVVTTDPKKYESLLQTLPKELDGLPVEIRPATPAQQLRIANPTLFASLAETRHELRLPQFDDEVFVSRSNFPRTLAAALEAARPRKPQIKYTPAPGVTLDPVQEQMTLTLHVSPDEGWAKLSEFLGAIEQDLVVGMYDFTSAHILDYLETAMAGKKLTLTLDHPPRNPTADETDEETVQDLKSKLDGDFESAWALTNNDPKASKWIFPNAYHIKVAVREDDTFWLSSGNWNNSNQPEIDLSNPAEAKQVAAKSDRDWHVIAASPGLAQKFRSYLEHDYQVASQNNLEPKNQALASAFADYAGLAVPDDLFATQGRQPRQFFPAKIVTDKIKIQPLLTPDNYQQHVLDLIGSARKSFYMQTQYIHPSAKPSDSDHAALIAAVQDRIDAGVDVRLITSEYQTADWIEKLKEAGLDTSVLRIQPKVHNKGIVVDGSVAMVSSQNWSADGTLRNRDAGLIIWHAEVAAYYEAIFLHDWNYLAAPQVSGAQGQN
jgi:phosphatidylserine/phosphatidylglycerophosphate/cardiolipin synthase-like enzyme